MDEQTTQPNQTPTANTPVVPVTDTTTTTVPAAETTPVQTPAAEAPAAPTPVQPVQDQSTAPAAPAAPAASAAVPATPVQPEVVQTVTPVAPVQAAQPFVETHDANKKQTTVIAAIIIAALFLTGSGFYVMGVMNKTKRMGAYQTPQAKAPVTQQQATMSAEEKAAQSIDTGDPESDLKDLEKELSALE